MRSGALIGGLISTLLVAALVTACGSDDGGTIAAADPGAASEVTGTDPGPTGGADPGPTGADEGGDKEPPKLPERYDLEGDDLFPEGVAYDAAAKRFLISSMTAGNVGAVARDGTQSVLYAGPGEDGWSTQGMKVEDETSKVWVCAVRSGADATAAIWGIDLGTGERTADIPLLDVAAGAVCNDVAPDGAGGVYVSDHKNPNIYKVDTGAGTAELWAENDIFNQGAVGLNGIELSSAGDILLVTHFLPAKLFAVPLSDPAAAAEVALDGDDYADPGTLFSGADGMVRRGDSLYLTFGAKLMQIMPADAGWSAATVKAVDVGDAVTAVTVAEGAFYAVKSEITAYIMKQPPKLPFALIRVEPSAFE